MIKTLFKAIVGFTAVLATAAGAQVYVEEFNDNSLIDTDKTTATIDFDEGVARLRAATGAFSYPFDTSNTPIFTVSATLVSMGVEVVSMTMPAPLL